MKKQFFLDLDGVVLDFETAFASYIRKNYDQSIPPDYVVQHFDMKLDFPHLDMLHLYDEFNHAPELADCPALFSAAEFAPLAAKHEVYFVTNMPYESAPLRQRNLEQIGLGQHQGLHFGGFNNFGDSSYPLKSQVIQSLRNPEALVVFVDDYRANCADVKEKVPNSEVYLMTCVHNATETLPTGCRRARDWADFLAQSLR